MLKIASASTCSGIRLSYKRVWKGTTIGKILSNRAYAGTVEALKTEAEEPRRRSKTTYGKTRSRLRPTEERIKLEGLVSRPVVTGERSNGSKSGGDSTSGSRPRVPGTGTTS